MAGLVLVLTTLFLVRGFDCQLLGRHSPDFAGEEVSKEMDSTLLSKLTSFGRGGFTESADSEPVRTSQFAENPTEEVESNRLAPLTATTESDKPEAPAEAEDQAQPAQGHSSLASSIARELLEIYNKTRTTAASVTRRRDTCNNQDEEEVARCKDYNAVCEAGLCVCRPGYFSHPLTSGHCRPVKSWLNNCDSDDQCQAFNPNLFCDTSLQERSFCNCAEGFEFNVQDYTCVACSKTNSTNNPEAQKQQDNSNGSVTLEPPNSTNPPIQPCKAAHLSDRVMSIKRELLAGYSSSQDLQPHKSSKTFVPSFLASHPLGGSAHASDPYRIKTPLEVFMGAIILFTLFTVTWFFLHRMIHDCRSIMRSLRNPEYANNCTDLNFTVGPLTSLTTNRDGVTTANHFSDSNVTSQAIARIIANEAYGGHLTGIYQRDLAGVLVQHLAGNLPASLSGHALTIGPDGLVNEHEPNLYPLAISAQQIRNGALPGAASQLILSPSNRAITILRSPAFDDHLAPDYNQISLLNSMLNDPPPPKYEEAMQQQANTINRNYITPPAPAEQPEQQISEATSNQPIERNSASEAETNANSPVVEPNVEMQTSASAARGENVVEISNSTSIRDDNDSALNK